MPKMKDKGHLCRNSKLKLDAKLGRPEGLQVEDIDVLADQNQPRRSSNARHQHRLASKGFTYSGGLTLIPRLARTRPNNPLPIATNGRVAPLRKQVLSDPQKACSSIHVVRWTARLGTFGQTLFLPRKNTKMIATSKCPVKDYPSDLSAFCFTTISPDRKCCIKQVIGRQVFALVQKGSSRAIFERSRLHGGCLL
jgi:hypothetical protein